MTPAVHVGTAAGDESFAAAGGVVGAAHHGVAALLPQRPVLHGSIGDMHHAALVLPVTLGGRTGASILGGRAHRCHLRVVAVHAAAERALGAVALVAVITMVAITAVITVTAMVALVTVITLTTLVTVATLIGVAALIIVATLATGAVVLAAIGAAVVAVVAFPVVLPAMTVAGALAVIVRRSVTSGRRTGPCDGTPGRRREAEDQGKQ